MAMITCPNCGEQISDKAKKCVHCGTVLVPEEKKYCLDCGAELEEGLDICPKCGCPIENIVETEKVPQQVEVTGVKITKNQRIHRKSIRMGMNHYQNCMMRIYH